MVCLVMRNRKSRSRPGRLTVTVKVVPGLPRSKVEIFWL